jgi:Xrn1 helical domain
MVNLSEFYTEIDAEGFATFAFGATTPFPNLAQLLSVLPPQSSDLLPAPLAELMVHPSSPLVPYYPQDFTSDPNGKRMAWEAVVQIPFIDADVLLDTVQKILDADVDTERPLLTPAERKRNERGMEHVYPPPGLTTPEEEVAYQRLKAASAVSSGTLPSSSRRSSVPPKVPFERRAPRSAKPAGAGTVRRTPTPRRRIDE